uniref:CatB-related O-acetyltransferase n=1 Tax=Thaumasiovibrio occultus TaxID=1891184 RepID=UPI00131ECAE2
VYNNAHVPLLGDVVLELPAFCAATLRWDTFLRIGAYANLNATSQIGHSSIGRYTSVAQNCFIGADKHPTDWLSASRMFYVPNFRGFDAFNGKSIKTECFTETGAPCFIGNDVLITNGCIISRGVTIGDGAIIAPGSVVTKDVPPYAIVGGNPAKLLKMRFPDEIISKLLELKWWDFDVYEFSGIDFKNVESCIE